MGDLGTSPGKNIPQKSRDYVLRAKMIHGHVLQDKKRNDVTSTPILVTSSIFSISTILTKRLFFFFFLKVKNKFIRIINKCDLEIARHTGKNVFRVHPFLQVQSPI